MYLSSLEEYISLLLYLKKLLKTLRVDEIYPSRSWVSDIFPFNQKNELEFIVKEKRLKDIKNGILKGTLGVPVSIDDNAVALVSPTVFRSRVFSGSWTLASFQSTVNKTVRWVQLYADPSIEEGCCCVPSTLYCNIPHNVLMKISINPSFTKPDTSHYFYYIGMTSKHCCLSPNVVPCVASSVQLSTVECSNFEVTFQLEELLKCHFNTPRVLSEGDIISIPLDLPKFRVWCFESNSVIPDMVYFKVIAIMCSDDCGSDSHVAIKNKSKFILSARCSSASLPHSEDCISYSGGISISPYLEKGVIEVSNIVRSHMDLVSKGCSVSPSSHSLSKTFFQHPGKVGHILLVGSHNDVRLLAECLRKALECVVYIQECTKLKTDTSGGVETKLTNAINNKFTSVPSVFVLHDIDILLKVRILFTFSSNFIFLAHDR